MTSEKSASLAIHEAVGDAYWFEIKTEFRFGNHAVLMTCGVSDTPHKRFVNVIKADMWKRRVHMEIIGTGQSQRLEWTHMEIAYPKNSTSEYNFHSFFIGRLAPSSLRPYAVAMQVSVVWSLDEARSDAHARMEKLIDLVKQICEQD